MVKDYRNGKNVEEEIIYTCYNDQAATITAGDLYFLSYEKDADSLDPSARSTVTPCATSSVYRKIVVALEDVADKAWGKFMYRGTCDVNVASSVVIDDYIKGTNATQEASDETTTISAYSFGIAVGDYVAATGLAECILFGERVTLG